MVRSSFLIFLCILWITSCAGKTSAPLVKIGPRASSYDAVNCANAPESSVLKLSPPAASYALIFCSPTGHTVAPVDGFLWFPINRPHQPFFFQAASKGGAEALKRAYFTQQVSKSLDGDALEKTNKMLEVGYQVMQKFSDVVQLDISTADGLLYNIFFYIANGRPVYVLGCVDRCNTSVLLQEFSLDEAKAMAGT